jgi:hypothetical protein
MCKHKDPNTGRQCRKQRKPYSLYCGEHTPADAPKLGRPVERDAGKFNVKLDNHVSRVFDYWAKRDGVSIHALMCEALGTWADSKPIPEPDPSQPNLPLEGVR